MTKKLLLVVLLCLSAGVSGFAQEKHSAAKEVSIAPGTATWLSAPLPVASVSAPLAAASFAAPLTAVTFAAPLATAAPPPRFVYGGREDYRWQLGFNYTYVRFRSTPINANLHGSNTSVVYYTNEWFGLEGAITAAFSSLLPGFNRAHGKLVLFTGGPRLAWRQRRWEPWAHALVGGVHLQPQTALGGRTSLAYSLGGGADFRWKQRLSLRLQADYVGTRLYSQTQHNYQIAAGPVFHF